MARPTKLTEQVQARVIAALEAGNYAQAAAEYAGISESTYYGWLERGRAELDRIDQAYTALEQLPPRAGKKRRQAAIDACEPTPQEGPFLAFLEAVTRASAEAETGAVRVLRRAMDGWTEPCPRCGGAGTVNVGHKSTSETTGAQARKSTQSRAEVRTCPACDGRGEIVHEPDWKAAMAFLERRHPDRWRRRTDMVVKGEEGAPPVSIVGADANTPAATDAAHELLRRVAGN